MTVEIKNRIIEATCSKTLQKAIKKTKHNFMDIDLLILIIRHAPNFDTKLNLLQLIAENTSDEKICLQAKRFIAYLETSLSKFISDDDDCIFDIKIKETPSAYEEQYIVKSFSNCMKTINNFCKYYEVTFTEQSRITITKHKFSDNLSAENFDEDWQGDAEYIGKCFLIDVSHKDHDNYLLIKEWICGDNNCVNCEENPCLIDILPKIPSFLEDFDVISYIDYDGSKQYGIYFNCLITYSCAYLIKLNRKAITGEDNKTKEQFEDTCFELHVHIEFPRLEKEKPSDLPIEIKKEYMEFLRLNKLFKLYGN